MHAVEADRILHVLALVRAEVLEAVVGAAVHCPIGQIGHADGAARRGALDPRGYVDAVAIGAAAALVDLAEMDADAEADRRTGLRLGLLQPLLEPKRRLDG